jgi:hypothetical protein
LFEIEDIFLFITIPLLKRQDICGKNGGSRGRKMGDV